MTNSKQKGINFSTRFSPWYHNRANTLVAGQSVIKCFIGINVNTELCLLCLYDCTSTCTGTFTYWCLYKHWHPLDSGTTDYTLFLNCSIGHIILKAIEFIPQLGQNPVTYFALLGILYMYYNVQIRMQSFTENKENFRNYSINGQMEMVE